MTICFFGDGRNLHIHHLAAGLASRGHLVHVVSHKPVEIPGVTVERFAVPRAGLTMPHRWHARWNHHLRGFLQRFDVVVLYFLHDFGFTPEIIQTGCFVATPRGSDVVPPPGEAPPSSDLVARRIDWLRHSAAVGAACPRFAAVVADFAGLDVQRIASLPLGVDLEKFRPARMRAQPAPDGPRVGFFKGFREVYGAVQFVEAIPAILAAVPNARFEMVGDGPLLTRCQELAMQLRVQGAISWLPRHPHEAMPGLLARWDVSAMPSHCESFGLAALESSAMGVPVVASNVGGLRDTVQDERTGLLVPPGSPRELATAILRLLMDPSRRAKMGALGRQWVADHYEWRKVLEQWEHVLEAALDRVCVAL